MPSLEAIDSQIGREILALQNNVRGLVDECARLLRENQELKKKVEILEKEKESLIEVDKEKEKKK
jgi:regulator of replication initiation timing